MKKIEINEMVKELYQRCKAFEVIIDNESKVFYLLNKPHLVLLDEESWEDEDCIEVTAFMSGNLIWEGLLNPDIEKYGICINVYNLQLKLRNEEKIYFKQKGNGYELEYACLLYARERASIERYKVPINEFMKTFLEP